MEKTIEIDGKKINLKSTGATPLRYKSQFGKDFFAEIFKLGKLEKINLDDKDIDYEALSGLDFEVFYNIIWTMAKTADKSIPEPLEWLDGFDEFPIVEILPQMQDMIFRNLATKKK
jgi:hypothetical protein